MRTGLFFLSVGLLAVGASPLRTSGQKATGGIPSLPAAHGFPPPVQKLASAGAVTLTSQIEGLYDEIKITWLRNDKAVVSSVVSTRNPSEENEKPSIYTTLSTYLKWLRMGDSYTSLMELKAPPPLTVQKITGKGTGDPSASEKTILRPHFQQGGTVSITCFITGFFPEGSSITWWKNGGPLPTGIYAVHNGTEHRSSMSSTLTLPEDEDHSGSYSCTLVRRGLKLNPPPAHYHPGRPGRRRGPKNEDHPPPDI